MVSYFTQIYVRKYVAVEVTAHFYEITPTNAWENLQRKKLLENGL